MNIKKEIRQDIIDIFTISETSWYGDLDDINFLERIFDLDGLPSFDSRFETAKEDIYQHRINNDDWDDNWIFFDSRFNLLGTDDNTFLRFICETLHPSVRTDLEQVNLLLSAFNEQLLDSGYMITVKKEIAGKPIYGPQLIHTYVIGKTQPSNLFFYRVPWAKNTRWLDSVPTNAIYPCVILISDNWNDFGFVTTFQIAYLQSPNSILFSNNLKILQEGRTDTNLPDVFTELNKNYCSLGQSIEYYENIKNLGFEIANNILTALNDVVYNKDIREKFELSRGFASSLLRFSEAEKAYNEAQNLFFDTQRVRKFKFQFSTTVPGSESQHIIDFNFSPDKSELHRITAIIGKNGTGKTQVLANFAYAMSGLKQKKGEFIPSKPSFSKVIALSYNYFDEFDKPQEGEKTFSYKYCGIKTKNTDPTQSVLEKEVYDTLIKNKPKLLKHISNEENKETERFLAPIEILEKINLSITQIREKKSFDTLINILNTLLSRVINENDFWKESEGINQFFYNSLSSGQRILVLILVELISNIVPESIILFDEPEIHLHPEALSALIRAFHIILDEYNSYAIIATHSPIVLQEVPAKFVKVFDRKGNYPVINELKVECFGDNLTAITEDVFHTTSSFNNYKDHLMKLAKKYPYTEVLDIFDNKLSLNARSYLFTLYTQEDQEI